MRSALRHVIDRRKAQREAAAIPPAAPTPAIEGASQQELDRLKALVERLAQEDSEEKVLVRQMHNTWELYAGRIADLETQDREKDKQIAALEQARKDDREHSEKTIAAMAEQLRQSENRIVTLENQLKTSEESRQKQGERLGKLEAIAREQPKLRGDLIKAQMAARIWEMYAAELRQAIREHNTAQPEHSIASHEPPHIPKIPEPTPEDMELVA